MRGGGSLLLVLVVCALTAPCRCFNHWVVTEAGRIEYQVRAVGVVWCGVVWGGGWRLATLAVCWPRLSRAVAARSLHVHVVRRAPLEYTIMNLLEARTLARTYHSYSVCIYMCVCMLVSV